MSKKPRELKYVGIDYWSRPRFIDQKGNYYGSLDKLYMDGRTFDEITKECDNNFPLTENDICYFGDEFDCDPMGDRINPFKIKLVKEFEEEWENTY